MSLEKFLLIDTNYYKQRAREFRQEILKFIDAEDYCENNIHIPALGIHILYNTSVAGDPLYVATKNTEYYDFSVTKDNNVRVYTTNINQFFDAGLDQEILQELKFSILKENTKK